MKSSSCEDCVKSDCKQHKKKQNKKTTKYKYILLYAFTITSRVWLLAVGSCNKLMVVLITHHIKWCW